nr:hypothetical protein [Verminephrobacter aporrectodeae]
MLTNLTSKRPILCFSLSWKKAQAPHATIIHGLYQQSVLPVVIKACWRFFYQELNDPELLIGWDSEFPHVSCLL